MKKFVSIILAIGMSISCCASAYATEYAYSIGVEDKDIDTSDSAKYAANCFSLAGYKSYYNVDPTIEYLEGDNPAGDPRLESSILFFAGHANRDNIGWDHFGVSTYPCGIYYKDSHKSMKTGYDYAGLDDYDLSNARLMMFMGCRTAYMATNLVTQAIKNGANCAIGWKAKVETGSASKWRNKFVDGLALGKTIDDAQKYANKFSYDDENVLKSKIVGDGSTDIVINSKSKSADDIEKVISTDNIVGNNYEIEHRDYEVNKSIDFDLYNPDYSELEEYIVNNIEQSFDIKLFKESIIDDIIDGETETGIVVLKLLIDGIESNSEIKVFVKNGYVDSIAVNGNIAAEGTITVNSTTEELTDEELFNIAMKHIEYDEQKSEITDYSVSKRIDAETKRIYYFVKVDFKDKDIETYFSKGYIYEP